MRARAGIAVVLAACNFDPVPITNPDATPIDASIDSPDATVSLRVQDGLIGFWTFDDAPGTTFLKDTSGATPAVPVEVITSGSIAAPALVGGTLVASDPGRLVSAPNNHLTADCAATGAVTLEAWVMPKNATHGTSSEATFIAGLAANISERNVALLQAGDKWVAHVRTTPALNGRPELVSTSSASSATYTHLVLVADATQRILYVDGVPEAVGTPGGPLGWNPTYPMAMIDEYQHARQWVGTLALVALYKRGLTPDEVQLNFGLGPAAP